MKFIIILLWILSILIFPAATKIKIVEESEIKTHYVFFGFIDFSAMSEWFSSLGYITLECSYPRCMVDEVCFWCYINNQFIGEVRNLRFKIIYPSPCMKFQSTSMSYFPNEVFEAFPHLERLDLSFNGLKVWKREYLKGAKNLFALTIWGNPIEHFSDDAFAEVPKLTDLTIVGSKITNLSPTLFEHLSHLTRLRLRRNDFSKNLPLNTFSALEDSIVEIDLDFTNMTQIPAGMFINCTKLESLHLGYSNIETIDASLTLPADLKWIYLGENSSTQVINNRNKVDVWCRWKTKC